MIDRESTFADPDVVEFLKNKAIPVAIDQWNQRRQKDSEGDFYRKIAAQGPRHDFENGTTQGLYMAAPDGTFLAYTNNRDPKRVQQTLNEAMAKFRPTKTAPLKVDKIDPRFQLTPPDGGLVVRVCAKVLGGYEEPETRYEQIFQTALSRDNLWLTAAEHRTLASGSFPDSVAVRIARFHLLDNTRGEAPSWKESDVVSCRLSLTDGVIIGHMELRSASGKPSYVADLRGHLSVVDDRVTALNMVASGTYDGHGQYTGGAPKKPFPLAVSFTLADGNDLADTIPPEAGRGWIDGYLR